MCPVGVHTHGDRITRAQHARGIMCMPSVGDDLPSGARRLPGGLAGRLASGENVCPAGGGAQPLTPCNVARPENIRRGSSPPAGQAEKFRHLIFSALSGVSGRGRPAGPAGPRQGRTFRPSSARTRLPDLLGFSRPAGRSVRFFNRPIPPIFRVFLPCGADRSHPQPPPALPLAWISPPGGRGTFSFFVA